MFDRLKAADRAPKLHAIFGIIHRHIKSHLCYPHHFGALRYRGIINGLLDERPTLMELTKQSISTNFYMTKLHLKLPICSNSLQRRPLNARRVAWHEQQADATVRCPRVAAPYGHQQRVGCVRMRDKQFGPVDHKATVTGHRTHTNPGRLKAGAGLRQRQRAEMLAFGYGRKVASLLRVAAAEQYRQTKSQHCRMERTG